jgi:hypothetical protein
MEMQINSQLLNNRAIDFGKNNKTQENKEKKNELKINQQQQNNDMMANFQKVKDNLLEQKNKLKEITMDPKEKKEKLKEIEDEIATVDAQMLQYSIQQKQEEIEKEKEAIEKKQAEDEKNNIKNGDEVRDGVIISASLNDFIKAGTALDNINRLKDIRARETVEAGYLGPTDKPNSFNAKRMAQIKRSAVNTEMNILSEIDNVNIAANKIDDKMKDKVVELKESKKQEEKENKIDKYI